MKGSDSIARILRAEGADTLFCFPINDVIDAGADVEIRPIMARCERAAVGMADGYSRVNNGRRIGICAVQHGPGAENAFGGVAQAYSDSSPILVLPGGNRQSRLGTRPNFEAVPIYGSITKWAARVDRPDRIPDLFRRAFTYLRTGRPGPVLLELPVDVLRTDVPDSPETYQPVWGTKSMANPDHVRSSVRALVAAKKPLIHAGAGVLYAEAWQELVELAELVQAPVMTTLPGKSGFPEDHPLSLGAGGNSGPRPVAQYLAECDLVFGVGASFTVSPFAAPIPTGKVAIQLTVDEWDLNKDYPLSGMLIGDARLVLRQMIEEVQKQLGYEGRRGDERTARDIRGLKEAWLSEWMPRLTSEDVPISPYRVVWELQHAVDLRATIATHDAGSPRDQMAPFWPALVPNSYIGWGKSTHLGYSLPLAMGAKMAKPDKTVVNIMGDAALGMSGMEINSAAQNHIGTLTILLNNSCLGGYDKLIPNASRLYGIRFFNGEYAKVAEGLGAYAEKVEKPDEIAPAVRRALKVTSDGRPALLEMITREENDLSKYW